MPAAAPKLITASDPSRIVIEWENGRTSVYPVPELRALCPCAGCVDEMSGVRTHDPGSVPAELTHEGAQLVGNYALTMRFSDGHHTGIYTFAMLAEHDPGE